MPESIFSLHILQALIHQDYFSLQQTITQLSQRLVYGFSKMVQELIYILVHPTAMLRESQIMQLELMILEQFIMRKVSSLHVPPVETKRSLMDQQITEF